MNGAELGVHVIWTKRKSNVTSKNSESRHHEGQTKQSGNKGRDRQASKRADKAKAGNVDKREKNTEEMRITASSRTRLEKRERERRTETDKVIH